MNSVVATKAVHGLFIQWLHLGGFSGLEIQTTKYTNDTKGFQGLEIHGREKHKKRAAL